MKIKITAPRDGYRRAGIQHSARGRVHDEAEFTDEQKVILASDPHLRVVPIGADGAAPGADDSGGAVEMTKPTTRRKAGG